MSVYTNQVTNWTHRLSLDGDLLLTLKCSCQFQQNSNDQTFWSQDPGILLKIIEDPEEFLFLWAISCITVICYTRN